MRDKQTILLVDDSENDLLLLRAAFKKAEYSSTLREVRNGQEAIGYLGGESKYSDRTEYPLPSLVLLDLNMPMKTGFEVVEWVRTQAHLTRLTIVILTASMREEDVERAYELGANAYLVKPSSIDGLVSMVRCLRDWTELNHFPPAL